MELGATVCTPQKVMCMMCPWVSRCVARKEDMIDVLPLKKPRKESEVWVWKPHVAMKDGKVGLVVNNYAPFLKGQMIFPGEISLEKNKPKAYDAKHNITHHDIFIQISKKKSLSNKDIQWVNVTELKRINPSSLLQKVLQKFD
jgi:A/G-specific adenine glycosylase